MKRLKRMFCVLLLIMPAVFGQDIIKTKSNQKYVGKILKTSKENRSFVIKTEQGNMVAVKFKDVLTVQRGNQVIDLVKGEKYYLEIRRPYLPFSILGVATAVYSVNQFKEYQRRKKKYDEEVSFGGGAGEQNLNDDSGEALALGIVSGLVSLGSFYVAIRPLEVKVPIGKVKVSGSPMGNGVMLSLNF